MCFKPVPQDFVTGETLVAVCWTGLDSCLRCPPASLLVSQEWALAIWAEMAEPICWCIPDHCQVFSKPLRTEPGRRLNPTTSLPSFDLADPNVRLVDLTGDGSSDALMTRDEHFLWFECLGEKGFAPPKQIRAQA